MWSKRFPITLVTLWSTPLTAEEGGVTVSKRSRNGSVVFHRNEAGTKAVGFGVAGLDDGNGGGGRSIAGRTAAP